MRFSQLSLLFQRNLQLRAKSGLVPTVTSSVLDKTHAPDPISSRLDPGSEYLQSLPFAQLFPHLRNPLASSYMFGWTMLSKST
jgi:hypothetical protein